MAYARLAPLGWQWTVDGVQQEKRRAAAACGSAEGKLEREERRAESGLRRLVPWVILRPVSTITAVLDADPDGTLHLPLPPDMHGTRVRIEAKLEATQPAPQAEGGLRAVMRKIRARNPFRAISDPVAWQRETREDVSLPSRD